MSKAIDELWGKLPPAIKLGQYNPERTKFPWKTFNPSKVVSTNDLPSYLILGQLDTSSFELSKKGWSALWQGNGIDTHFDVTYISGKNRYEIRQTWCGEDGGFSLYSASIPLDILIGQTLNREFPSNWDARAKEDLEAKFQLTYVEQPKGSINTFFIPDGAFRTIAFPVSAKNLRPVYEWISLAAAELNLSYPFGADARLLFQAINYLEGRAADWTSNPGWGISHSLNETGLMPLDFPVKETANDGTSAWTVRRYVYVLFIDIPFAGLTDFLERLCKPNGSIRRCDDPDLPIEMRPFVIPLDFMKQTKNISYWDKQRSTRCFWLFHPDEEQGLVPKTQAGLESEGMTESLIESIEKVSSDMTDIFTKALNKAQSGKI